MGLLFVFTPAPSDLGIQSDTKTIGLWCSNKQSDYDVHTDTKTSNIGVHTDIKPSDLSVHTDTKPLDIGFHTDTKPSDFGCLHITN